MNESNVSHSQLLWDFDLELNRLRRLWMALPPSKLRSELEDCHRKLCDVSDLWEKNNLKK